MSLSLGEKLRQAREERGISISEVAEQTRISSQYIECIENDNYRPLPGGIFNKGFVKSYAKFIGLDEQEALGDYAGIVAANSVLLDSGQNYRPEVLTDDNATGSMVPTIIFAGIILALMTGGILFLVNYFQNQSEGTTKANPNQVTNADTATAKPGVTPDAIPAGEPIKLEFMAIGERVSVTSTIDGRVVSEEVQPDSVRIYTARESLKLRYYRGFADKLQLTLNGKRIASPPPPPKGNIEFEINRENLAQIWGSGEIVPPGQTTVVAPVTQPTTAPSLTPETAPTPTQTPKPPASVLPSPTASATPRPSPTPLPTGTRAPANNNRPRSVVPSPSPE